MCVLTVGWLMQSAAAILRLRPVQAVEAFEERIILESYQLRQVKYLGSLFEQAYRFIKDQSSRGGFSSVEGVGQTLQGYEVMNMVRKAQRRGLEKGIIMGQVAFFSGLFGVAT